jgi:hypothetical protein
LKDKDLLCRLSKCREALNGGRTSTDEGHALASKANEVAARTASGIVIIPSTCVECTTLEVEDTLDPRKFR